MRTITNAIDTRPYFFPFLSLEKNRPGTEAREEADMYNVKPTYPSLCSFSTSSTVMPKMKMLSAPISSLISTLAPSKVPMVSAPFAWEGGGVEFNIHWIEARAPHSKAYLHVENKILREHSPRAYYLHIMYVTVYLTLWGMIVNL